MTEAGQARSLNERDYPRNLANADSKAVTPISPAAQKFHLFIFCSALDSSVTVSNSSAPGLMPGRRHCGREPEYCRATGRDNHRDLNERSHHRPQWFRMDRDYTADPNYRMVMSVFGTRPLLAFGGKADGQANRPERRGRAEPALSPAIRCKAFSAPA